MDSWDEESEDFSESPTENVAEKEDTEDKITNGKKRSKDQSSKKPKKVKYEPISTGNSKKNRKKNDLFRPPTVEELNNLKETENLYNNNLFRLQIEELIKEISIKNKRKTALNSWLESFKTALDNLPQLEDITLNEIVPISKTSKLSKKEKVINRLATNYKCPFKTDLNIDLKFKKPESFECFGLYENNSLAGPHLGTKINVKMPRECFLSRDYQNNRYIVKRFYYLLYLCEHIPGHRKSLEYHENNVLLPVLKVQPTEDEKIIVKIYATPSEDYFKESRFLPNQNNIKKNVFESEIKDVEVLRATPTVLYNSALAHDTTLTQNAVYVKSSLTEHPNVQDGIKLICVWLKQRDLNLGYGGFSETLAMYFVVYLLSKKKINKFMSSYQVVRNFWSFIATTDIENNPISIGQVEPNTLEMFKKSFDVVFLDVTGCLNLTALLDTETLKKVKLECNIAMKHLDDNKIESFHFLFLTKLPFCLQYDSVLDVTEALPLKNLFITSDVEKSKNTGYEPFLHIKYLSNFLQKGLNKRILNLVPYVEIKYPENDEPAIQKVLFGINLNPETAFNFLEMGPPLSNHIEADEFRKFWGHLSSDRRFRDGSTHVAVYFKTSTIRSKRAIIKRIIKFLLTEKLKIDFKLYYDEFEEFISNKKVACPYPVGTNEEASLKIITLADELGQKIRNFQLSLHITGIQGISDAFSYSEVFPPIAARFKPAVNVTEVKQNKVIFSGKKITMIPKYVEPIEMVLQLEHSSKWPNNLEAVRHIKTSFHIELSKMLLKSHNILSHATRDHLEVFYEGIIFRYRLYVPKEIALIKKQSSETGVVKYADTEYSVELEKSLDVLPKLNGALKGIQLQYPSFGPGTALIKRWLRSQLIDEYHLPDIVINLLNASLYLNGSGFTESCTPQVSFLRFLKFISEFEWNLQPLIVNFNDEISKQDVVDLESKFQQHRDEIQPLYIIIPYDQGQSLFTRKIPSKEVLFRVQELAKVTLDFIVERMVHNNAFEIKKLFIPNMEGYNLLIHLKPLLNPRRHEQIESSGDSKISLEKYVHHEKEKIPIAGFDPVQLYLKSLHENYGEFATFFHDTYGGSTIGVLWIPKALETNDFKVSHVNGRKLVKNKLELNMDAIIEDFYLIGKGIVKWIEKK